MCVCVCCCCQKNPISFVEIYSDTFLWMLLTSLSTTNPLKLLEETKRDREKENQGGKKKQKRKDGGLYGHIRHLHLLLLCMKQIGRKIEGYVFASFFLFFFAVCFFGLFSPSLQEEIDVIMIKNVGAFDDPDGNVLLPVCFSHHWQQDFSEKCIDVDAL